MRFEVCAVPISCLLVSTSAVWYGVVCSVVAHHTPTSGVSCEGFCTARNCSEWREWGG